MIPLPIDFRKEGWAFHQIKRQGKIVLLQKTKAGATRLMTSWEVVVIRCLPDEMRGNTKVPAHEIMPSSEQWGTYGWTFTSLSDAEKFFNQKTKEKE